MSIVTLLMTNKYKKKFEEKIENKFLDCNKFSIEIESIVSKNKELNYIDAVLMYCTENNIDIENISKLISKQLKKKIENDALQLNFLKKKKRTVKLKF